MSLFPAFSSSPKAQSPKPIDPRFRGSLLAPRQKKSPPSPSDEELTSSRTKMPVEVDSARPSQPPAHMRIRNLSHTLSHADDDDNVVGLGVPHGDGEDDDEDDDDSEFVSQEQDERMTEMILKHRSQIQRFVERTIDATTGVSATGGGSGNGNGGDAEAREMLGFPPEHDNLQNIPPSPSDEAGAGGRFDAGFRTPQTTRSKAGERLMQLSRTERTDRMRLAELSEVGKERLGRAAILRWNPHAKLSDERENRTFVNEPGYRNGAPATRERSLTTPTRTTAKMLGEISKDYVQQALDFNHPDAVGDDDDDHIGLDDDDDDDDDDDLTPPSPDSLHELLDHQPRGRRSARKVKKYVKQMETTIAQLVQQKGELLRNQAEFDKHASGMFPTLETLNDQLSQIVQERMLQSQVNIKDDLDSEMRVLRVRLNELESDAKQRRNDAELQDQRRQLDIAQIKGEIASLGTTGTLQNQKLELASSQIKRLQQEIQESLEVNQSLSRQYQMIDQRITTVQTTVKESRSISVQQNPSPSSVPSSVWAALWIVIVSLVMALLSADRCSGVFGQCHPLT